jgi:spermidine synthase
MLYTGKNFYLTVVNDEIIAYSNGGNEYGRFNFKTGLSRQWYSRVMLDHAYTYIRTKPNASICVLGGAVAAMPYELLLRCPSVHLTTVDIDAENVEVLQHMILSQFGERSTVIAEDAKKFVKTLPAKSFDIIISDISIHHTTVPFVMSTHFTKDCLRLIKPGGLLITNILSKNLSDDTYGKMLRTLGREFTRTAKSFYGLANLVYKVS